jgi:hypothetical protein
MDDFYEWTPPYLRASQQQALDNNSWGSWSLNRVMGISFIASFLQNEYLFNSFRLLIVGTIIETGRRLCYWLMERFQFRASFVLLEFEPAHSFPIEYGVTARFEI